MELNNMISGDINSAFANLFYYKFKTACTYFTNKLFDYLKLFVLDVSMILCFY